MEGVIDSKTNRWLFVYLSNLDECRKDVSPIFVGDFIYEALWESPSQLPLKNLEQRYILGQLAVRLGLFMLVIFGGLSSGIFYIMCRTLLHIKT